MVLFTCIHMHAYTRTHTQTYTRLSLSLSEIGKLTMITAWSSQNSFCVGIHGIGAGYLSNMHTAFLAFIVQSVL